MLNAFSLKLSGNGSSISCSRSHGEDVVDANEEEDEEVGEEEEEETAPDYINRQTDRLTTDRYM